MGRRFEKTRNKLNRKAMKPLKQSKFVLRELVSKITPQNRHPETNWGRLVGKETV
jgi:antitoxin component of MazEF toxin-antitoxin module